MDKVRWDGLAENQNAIHIIEKNLDKMNTECWKYFSSNPNIFIYDSDAMENALY